jgi:quinol monooxygenase YgiN
MIRVIAFITTKPGKRGEFLESFKAVRPAVLAEKGCREYVATVDNPASQAPFGPETIAIIETWDSLEDFGAHAVGQPLKEHGGRTKDLIEKRAVHILNPT